MSRPNKASRRKAAQDLERLSLVFGPRSAPPTDDWHFSNVFESSDECNPLESVQFDNKTCRYESTDKSVETDDFIAQSMVMLILLRLELGIGFWSACKQLSIVGGKQSSLENVWLDEICALIDKKRLGPTTFHHQDNFDGFRQCYSIHEKSKWQRRHSKSNLAIVHEFAEQAVVQWALNLIQDERFQDYPFLASSMIRLAKTGHKQATKDFSTLLYESAIESDSSEDYFGKITINNMSRPAKRSRHSY